MSIWGATIVLGAIDDAGDELDRSIDEFDSYIECVDAIEIDDPDFDEKMAACEE